VVNEHRIRFEGAAAAALTIATAIADADGVDLTSSEPPATLADGRVRLDLTVQGSSASITAAVDEIGSGLPAGSSLELDPG
jgi:hypothetical protein